MMLQYGLKLCPIKVAMVACLRLDLWSIRDFLENSVPNSFISRENKGNEPIQRARNASSEMPWKGLGR
jgi:hypothetical protein